MNGVFETVLKANKEYAEAVARRESAEVQKNLLVQCEILFDTMIRKAGLCNEYAEYCKRR